YGFCAFETCIIKTEILIFLSKNIKYIYRYFVPDTSIFLCRRRKTSSQIKEAEESISPNSTSYLLSN
ncbi:hypothetical protein BYT27DRAFT_7201686, partial [Phlegmacium glaucopus]